MLWGAGNFLIQFRLNCVIQIFYLLAMCFVSERVILQSTSMSISFIISPYITFIFCLIHFETCPVRCTYVQDLYIFLVNFFIYLFMKMLFNIKPLLLSSILFNVYLLSFGTCLLNIFFILLLLPFLCHCIFLIVLLMYS